MPHITVERPLKPSPQISNHLRLRPADIGRATHRHRWEILAPILHTLNRNTTQPPTVFVVDDDPQLRGEIALLLDSIGINVETFESAESFLETFDPSRPGCVVLDLNKPGLGGFELVGQLIFRGLRVPILMLTTHTEIAMEDDALKTGTVDLIGKPFCQHVFLNWVRQAINGNRRLD